MRNKILTLYSALTLLSLSLTGQPKKSTTITVQADSAAFATAISVLAKAGYFISYSNEAQGIINTEYKTLSRVTMRLSVYISGQSVRISGLFNMIGFGTSDPSQIAYRGMEGSPYRIAWDAMASIAHQIGNHPVYSVE